MADRPPSPALPPRHSRLRRLPGIPSIRRPQGPRHLPTNQNNNPQQGGHSRRQRRQQQQQQRIHPRGAAQIGLVRMGEFEQGVWQQLLIRLHPFRKYIWALCALSVLLALLIILNSIWLIAVASSTRVKQIGDTSFVIFSEVLAWLLLLFSGLGFKMTCMAGKAVEAEAASRRVRADVPSVELALELADQRRPFSAPNWIALAGGWPALMGEAGAGGPFDLPGAVPRPEPPFDPFLFPPPPPRYSSLELPPPTLVRPGRRASLMPGGLAPVQHSSSSGSSPSSAGFVRSPPPPYCSPNG